MDISNTICSFEINVWHTYLLILALRE